MHFLVSPLISLAAFVAIGSGQPRTEEADDSMVLAFFDAVLAPEKKMPTAQREGCVAIRDGSGRHDPESHVLKVLRKRYPWVQPASRCDKKAPVLSVGPFWRNGARIFGLAGVEEVIGRCSFEAVSVAPRLWRVEPQPCLLE